MNKRIIFLLVALVMTVVFLKPVVALKPTDLNDDGEVDVKDINIAANALGSYPGHPRWNADADIDEDDRVDIRDVFHIALDFGS